MLLMPQEFAIQMKNGNRRSVKKGRVATVWRDTQRDWGFEAGEAG